MKVSECRQSIQASTVAFYAQHQITADSEITLSAETKYNPLIYLTAEDSQPLQFKGIYLATFEAEKDSLQWPFHPDNPAIAPEDKAFYRTLQDFGVKASIPELSETNISFDALFSTHAQIHRRMTPPMTFRNPMGEVVSIYTLDELIAIAATFHKVKAVISMTMHPYTIFLGVMDAQPITD